MSRRYKRLLGYEGSSHPGGSLDQWNRVCEERGMTLHSAEILQIGERWPCSGREPYLVQ